MNLFELFVKVGVDDQASGKLSGITEKLGNGLKTAAKIGTAAVSAAAAGVTALTTAAVNNYAEYEQLVGGVETLFKDSADTVMKYAEDAYKTAGMSANEYMSTVTGFSAALLRSVGGDTEKAAKLADTAITDMSDNANKMGVSLESLQNAYTGFSRGNFTMLDNLALGFSGTKEGMQELLDTAKELSGVEYDIESYADIVEAIHVVQTEMGITGTTAKEAASTISGSANMMKAAWSNLVTGIADDNADFNALMGDLVESVGAFADNLMPRIEVALSGVGQLVSKFIPIIIKRLPSLANAIVPELIAISTELVNSLVEILPELVETLLSALSEQSSGLIEAAMNTLLLIGEALVENAPLIIDAIAQLLEQLMLWFGEYSYVFAQVAVDILTVLINSLVENLPALIDAALILISYLVEALTNPENLSKLLDAALTLLTELVTGLVEAVPQLVDAAIELINGLIDFILDEQNLSNLINAALDIIMAISEGLVKAIPQLVDAAVELIDKLCEFFLDPENIATLLDMAFEIVVAIVEGLGKAAIELVKGAFDLIGKLKEAFKVTDWKGLGKNIVNGIWEGLKSTWEGLKKWFTNAWDSLVGGVKNLLGIKSPSRVFADIGENMALGVEKGWGNEYDDIRSQIEKDMDFGTVGVDFASSAISGGLSRGYEAGVMSPITIVVQSVLDGEIIGETAYRYSRNKTALVGA